MHVATAYAAANFQLSMRANCHGRAGHRKRALESCFNVSKATRRRDLEDGDGSDLSPILEWALKISGRPNVVGCWLAGVSLCGVGSQWGAVLTRFRGGNVGKGGMLKFNLLCARALRGTAGRPAGSDSNFFCESLCSTLAIETDLARAAIVAASKQDCPRSNRLPGYTVWACIVRERWFGMLLPAGLGSMEAPRREGTVRRD